jgi:transcriptional regulator with XRE-family HTH domain
MNHPEPLTPKQFAELLREEIDSSSMKAKDIFEKADIPISYYYRWRTGEVRDPTPAEIARLANILDKSPYYFLFGKNSEHILLKVSHLEQIMKHADSISSGISQLLKANSLTKT